MGSWNESCLATGLPIRAMEPVEVILTRGNVPYMFSISGEYDDYGKPEEVHGHGVEYILKTMKLDAIQKEAKDHHPAVCPELFDIDSIFDLIQEGRLETKFWSNMTYRPQFHLIHSDVYEMITDSHVNTYSGYGFGLQHFMDARSRFVEAMSKDRVNSLDYNTSEGFLIGCLTQGYNRPYMNKEVVPEIDTTGMSVIEAERARWKREDHGALLLLKDSPELYENACRVLVFASWMYAARRSYTCVDETGSQNDSTEAQELMANVILAKADWIKEDIENNKDED